MLAAIYNPVISFIIFGREFRSGVIADVNTGRADLEVEVRRKLRVGVDIVGLGKSPPIFDVKVIVVIIKEAHRRRPQVFDMDITANATLHILAAKVGATVGDAVTFTVEAFNNVVDALYDADADFGGATDAMTGDAATKTVQHVTRTLALANLAAYPAAVELTIQPTDGTLGTDDVIMLAHWIEYQRKLLAA